MTRLNAIAAVGDSWQLGLAGRLPWHDSEDLQWFREMTAGGFLIAGHNTYAGLATAKETSWFSPGTIFPDRIVMSDGPLPPDRTLALIDKHYPSAPVWVIGGEKTYGRYAPYINQLYLSRVPYSGPADRHFPMLAFDKKILQQAVWRNGLGLDC